MYPAIQRDCGIEPMLSRLPDEHLNHFFTEAGSWTPNFHSMYVTCITWKLFTP